MTAPSTTLRRLWSFWVDGVYLQEPRGSTYYAKGMTTKQTRELQKLMRKTNL